MKPFPCCYYPTTVYLIDDDAGFLENLNLSLKRNEGRYKLITQPQHALETLNANSNKHLIENWIKEGSLGQYEHRSLELDLTKIYQEVNRKDRFQDISTIVIDFNMPGMNGLDFIRNLSGNHHQKILLTGEADEYLAVEAFNNGLIHQFIRKQDPQMLTRLEKALSTARFNFFQNQTQVVWEAITKNAQEEPTCLDDPKFIEFFKEWCADNDIVEYYLIESFGSFLTYNSKGEASAIFLKSEDQMEAIALEAEDDEALTATVRDALSKREQMLCFIFDETTPLPATEEWSHFLAPAQKIEGATTYYFAVTQNIPNLDLTQRAAFSA